MNFLKITAAATVVAFAGLGAQAATLDFENVPGVTEKGVADGTSIVIGGHNITFSADSAAGDGFAYFDGPSNKKPGGLGVCATLGGGGFGPDQCNPSSDDNLTFGEHVTLMFDYMVEFAVTTFRDSGHVVLTGNDTLSVQVDGGAVQVLTFDAALGTPFVGKSFTFGYGSEQYYISGATATAIPLPAAGFLLLAGLGGLAAMRRKNA